MVRGLKRQVSSLDLLVVQDVGLQGAKDPDVLAWAAERRRILVSHDANTIHKHAYDRVRSGEPMTGVIVIPADLAVGVAIAELMILNDCCTPEDCDNRILYLPI